MMCTAGCDEVATWKWKITGEVDYPDKLIALICDSCAVKVQDEELTGLVVPIKRYTSMIGG